MALKNWKEALDAKLPDHGPITEEMVECAANQARRYRGSTRIALGKIWTDEDFEKRRCEVLRMPLP